MHFTARRTSDFDPAVYFGDREVDVAMTELFGGFPLPFIAAITKYSLNSRLRAAENAL